MSVDQNQVPFLLLPNWLGLPVGVRALSTTRNGGTSLPPYDGGSCGGKRSTGNGFNLGEHVGDDINHVLANRAALESYIEVPVTFLSQIHGNIAIDADDWRPGIEADAVVSTRSKQVCAIQTADCLPVLFAAKNGRVVGAAHAGWRGLAAGVLQNTVKAMRQRGADEITAWLGPAIGPASFEVGKEVKDEFEAVLSQVNHCFTPHGEAKYLANLYALARVALQTVGVVEVTGGEYCTYSDHQRFYSYRRDRVTGRMASLIWRE
ncbi:peptidoglycan editing factor PgeF [Undibacterium cyanobacteriorum]|uniref:Purine nucleoside phosphorylase n=1 Tax=Undibacterium cyanobacteriorum TaxID=3073561 RepID=A0ABY9RCI8_9BURK|nr:peptidoglycan editing factor PgeF [Undibacterium sp. 20NA77.5]WMW78967.1 peptidoglycan editing factor PgeF [Undibacterium sp. 20NA77.5]